MNQMNQFLFFPSLAETCPTQIVLHDIHVGQFLYISEHRSATSCGRLWYGLGVFQQPHRWSTAYHHLAFS